MQKELTPFEIVETCSAIKKQYRTLSADGSKKVIYKIYYQNPSTSQDWQQYASGCSREQALEQFDTDFDNATRNNKGAIRVRVVFSDSKNNILSDQKLPIQNIAESIPAPLAPTRSLFPDEPVVRMPQPEAPKNDILNNVGTLLGLMGFKGLDGADTSAEMGALGAILQVRDNMKDAQYERQDMLRKYEEAIAEKALLKEKINGLEGELTVKNKQIEKYKTENDELQDEVDELQEELQKRETVTGLGSIAIQKIAGNIIRKNPETVSKLLGISPEDMLGMIDGEQVEQVSGATSPIPNVEVEAETPRQQAIKPIMTFCDTLNDSDFNDLSAILQVFQNNPQTIKATMKWFISASQRHEQAQATQGVEETNFEE